MAETVDAKNTNSESEVLQPVSFDEFDVPSYDQWKAEAEKALKGGIFDKKCSQKRTKGLRLIRFIPQNNIKQPLKHLYSQERVLSPGAQKQVVTFKKRGAYLNM